MEQPKILKGKKGNFKSIAPFLIVGAVLGLVMYVKKGSTTTTATAAQTAATSAEQDQTAGALFDQLNNQTAANFQSQAQNFATITNNIQDQVSTDTQTIAATAITDANQTTAISTNAAAIQDNGSKDASNYDQLNSTIAAQATAEAQAQAQAQAAQTLQNNASAAAAQAAAAEQATIVKAAAANSLALAQAKTQAAAQAHATFYTVTKGMTVQQLSSMYGVSQANLIKNNSLNSKGALTVGQKLVIRT